MSARFWLGTCLVDLDRNELRRGPEAQRLTAREAELLAFLARHPGADVGRATLMRDVFGYHPDAESRAVDFTVHRLRRKVEPDPAHPVHLVSSPGHGYRLDGVVQEQVTTQAPPVVAPRPADPTLLGRAAELDALDAWAAAPGAPRFLVGPGGVGKTRLARALLERRGEGVFVDLSLSEATNLDVEAALRSAAQGPPLTGTLIVLDNAEHVQPLVEAWLAGPGRGHRVLVTSRLAAEGRESVTVAPLDEENGLALLGRYGQVEAEVGRALVAALDGLPLALELAGARLGTVPAASLVRRLGEGRVGLLRGEGTGRQGSLDALLAWSWALLSERSRALLRGSVAFAAPFDFEGLVAVTGMEPEDVADGLAEAERHHWLTRREGRLRLAPPVRAWLGDPPPGTFERHAAWCLGGDAPLADRLRAVDRADPATRLALARALPADEFGPDESMVARAARLRALLEFAPEDATLRWALGMACAMSGARVEARAQLEEAARLAVGDEALLGRIEGQLGNVASYGGAPDEAIGLYTLAVGRLHRIGDRVQAATFQANLGGAWLARGDLAAAEENLLLALGDMEGARPANRGRAHANLASLYLRRGQPELADHHDGLAEACFREANDRMCLGQLLGNRAARRLDAGELVLARQAVAEALAVHRQLGNLRSEALALMTMGDIATEDGDRDALRHFAMAAARLASAGDRRFEGWARWRWGRATVLAGGEGDSLVREGVRMTAAAGDARGAAIGQWVLAALDPRERATARAEDALTRSLAAVLDRRTPEVRDHEVRLQERLLALG